LTLAFGRRHLIGRPAQCVEPSAAPAADALHYPGHVATDLSGRIARLARLGGMLREMPWIRAVMWWRLPSRGKVQQRGTGIGDRDIECDPPAAAQLREIIRNGLR
jgi:hypothetical protein